MGTVGNTRQTALMQHSGKAVSKPRGDAARVGPCSIPQTPEQKGTSSRFLSLLSRKHRLPSTWEQAKLSPGRCKSKSHVQISFHDPFLRLPVFPTPPCAYCPMPHQ